MRCRCLSYGSCALIRHGWGLVRLVWTFATSLCGSSNIERRQMMADYVLETQPLTDKDMAALEATMPAKAVTRNGSMEKQLAAWKAKAEAYVANHVLRSSLIAGAAGAGPGGRAAHGGVTGVVLRLLSTPSSRLRCSRWRQPAPTSVTRLFAGSADGSSVSY